jgi:hypothetical protein
MCLLPFWPLAVPLRVLLYERTSTHLTARCPTVVSVYIQNIPEDFILRNISGQEIWVSEGEMDSVEIKEQSRVRIRIANIQLQAEKLVRATSRCLPIGFVLYYVEVNCDMVSLHCHVLT